MKMMLAYSTQFPGHSSGISEHDPRSLEATDIPARTAHGVTKKELLMARREYLLFAYSRGS